MKQIAIDRLLCWAYREELPKSLPAVPLKPAGFGGPWGSITRAGELGDTVQEPDVRNRYGLCPDFSADREPKPDAIRVWEAVKALRLDPVFPDDWNPLSDMGDLGPLGHAAVIRGVGKLVIVAASGESETIVDPQYLLRKHAIMGDCPIWEADKPELKHVSAHGKEKWFRRTVITTEAGSLEVEVDGFDRKRRRPFPDAYRKPYLDPDPVEFVVSRGEYAVWHAALCCLEEDLHGRLEEFDLLPLARQARPWDHPAEALPRVLLDRRPVAPLPKLQRPIAGPLWRPGRRKRDRRPADTAEESESEPTGLPWPIPQPA